MLSILADRKGLVVSLAITAGLDALMTPPQHSQSHGIENFELIARSSDIGGEQGPQLKVWLKR